MNKQNKKHKWNLTPLYKSDTDPQISKDMELVKKVNYKFINKWQSRNDYLKDPKILRQALDELDVLETNFGITGKYGYYFSLRSAQEEDNSKIKGILNKIENEAVKIANDLEFFGLRLAKVPENIQKRFLKAKELDLYNHYLKKVFESSEHLLSEPEEKILNLKSSPSHGKWVDMTSTLLSKQTRKVYDESGKLVELPLSEISSLTSSTKKRVRDTAFKAIVEINNRYAEVAEAELNAILDNKKVNDELRGFDRPDKARHMSDDIETEVVDALVKAVSDKNKIANDYYKLKADLFGKNKLDYQERNVPYGKAEKKYDWDKSVQLVSKTLNSLDPEFKSIFDNFVKDSNIDVFPYKGKSGGGFCAYNLKSQPTYILLNHTEKLQDVLTLAHETGHGINDELMKQTQPAVYFSTSLATAEVASTFMEDFVLEEVMKEANDNLRLSLMMDKLNDDISTIFRQIAGYRFEDELHKEFRREGYLSKEDIGKIFSKNMKNYMGPSVTHQEGTENFWVPWSHFRNFFYVYSYASGLLISKSLQASVRQDPTFIKKVKGFLSAGSSESPKEIFAKLDIDITDKKFWDKGLEEIDALLKETRVLAKRLGKI